MDSHSTELHSLPLIDKNNRNKRVKIPVSSCIREAEGRLIRIRRKSSAATHVVIKLRTTVTTTITVRNRRDAILQRNVRLKTNLHFFPS